MIKWLQKPFFLVNVSVDQDVLGLSTNEVLELNFIPKKIANSCSPGTLESKYADFHEWN